MADDDLFSGAAAERLSARAPLASRLRPHTLDDIVGQQHLVGPGAPLRALIESDRLTSAILWGPPGTGKTTLASVVATATAKHFVPMSAVTAGVKDVREVVEGARRRLGEQGAGTILFLDEVHRFNRSQQDALLPSVEEGLVVLIGATTENPFFEVNAPLLSRSTLWRLEPLSHDELEEVVARGLRAEGASAEPDAVAALVGLADGDARAVLTTLEVALALAGPSTGLPRPRGAGPPLPPAPLRGGRPLRPGQRVHQVHPGIRPRRRPVLAGPDARGRRGRPVHRPAAGDPGQRGHRRGRSVGPGGGRRRRSGRRVRRAARGPAQPGPGRGPPGLRPQVEPGHRGPGPGPAGRAGRPRGDVPGHLRDAHYRSAATIGHGEGYVYPHDEADAWVDQEYRPAGLAGNRYYEPSDRGHEAVVGERLRRWRHQERTGPVPTRRSRAPRTVEGDAGPDRGCIGETEPMVARWLTAVSRRWQLPAVRVAVVGLVGLATVGLVGLAGAPPPAAAAAADGHDRRPAPVLNGSVRLSGPPPSLPPDAAVIGPADPAATVTADVFVRAARSGRPSGVRGRRLHAGTPAVPPLSGPRAVRRHLRAHRGHAGLYPGLAVLARAAGGGHLHRRAVDPGDRDGRPDGRRLRACAWSTPGCVAGGWPGRRPPRPRCPPRWPGPSAA